MKCKDSTKNNGNSYIKVLLVLVTTTDYDPKTLREIVEKIGEQSFYFQVEKIYISQLPLVANKYTSTDNLFHCRSPPSTSVYSSKEALLFSLRPPVLFNSLSGPGCSDTAAFSVWSSWNLSSSFTLETCGHVTTGVALTLVNVQTCSCLFNGALFLNLLPHPRPHNK